MKTTAVIFESPGKVAMAEVEVLPPGPGEVQIETEVSVVSPGTEGWVLNNVFSWQPTTYPCIPGYQRVGKIIAVGEDVVDWEVGDRVVATLSVSGANVPSMWGSHAGVSNTATSEIYRLPPDVSAVNAAGFVVAQVGYNAASRVALTGDDWVVVYGDGIIGQCAAQAMRARGAKVVLVGHRSERLALATVQGIEAVVNSKAGNVADEVRRLTGLKTVTAVLDSIQGEAAQRDFISLLAPRQGQIVYCGFSSGTAWADMAVLQQRELTTHFVSGWTREKLQATLGLMSTGQMNLEALITHRVPAAKAPDMYAMIATKSEPFLGIAFDWKPL